MSRTNGPTFDGSSTCSIRHQRRSQLRGLGSCRGAVRLASTARPAACPRSEANTTIGEAPGLMGAAYFIPTILVPLLSVTHVLVFRLLLRGESRAVAGDSQALGQRDAAECEEHH